MTRRYDDPVDVRRRDDAPAEFLWRGRLYVVREVLTHWVESSAWWGSPVARSVQDLDASSYDNSGGDNSGGDNSSRDSLLPSLAGAVAVDTADVSIAAELEVWRVEASAGRMYGTGVFELGFTWAQGSWTLLQVLD